MPHKVTLAVTETSVLAVVVAQEPQEQLRPVLLPEVLATAALVVLEPRQALPDHLLPALVAVVVERLVQAALAVVVLAHRMEVPLVLGLQTQVVAVVVRPATELTAAALAAPAS